MIKDLLDISRYVNQVKKKEPMDQSFLYSLQKWESLKPSFKKILKKFANKKIRRSDIIKSYKEYFNGTCKRAEKPFLLTMIWGYAKAGYGYSRTMPFIEKSVFENIISALEYVKGKKIEDAFEKLQSIKGLGISFISKILYFSSKAIDKNNYWLIFDSRVASSLLKLSVGEKTSKLFKITPSDKFEDYKDYNMLMRKIAEKNSLHADAIEMFLYEQKFK